MTKIFVVIRNKAIVSISPFIMTTKKGITTYKTCTRYLRTTHIHNTHTNLRLKMSSSQNQNQNQNQKQNQNQNQDENQNQTQTQNQQASAEDPQSTGISSRTINANPQGCCTCHPELAPSCPGRVANNQDADVHVCWCAICLARMAFQKGKEVLGRLRARTIGE